MRARARRGFTGEQGQAGRAEAAEERCMSRPYGPHTAGRLQTGRGNREGRLLSLVRGGGVEASIHKGSADDEILLSPPQLAPAPAPRREFSHDRNQPLPPSTRRNHKILTLSPYIYRDDVMAGGITRSDDIAAAAAGAG